MLDIDLSMGGNYSLKARLRDVRAKLFEINSAVRKLESNMIFLLVNPELVTYASSESSGNSSEPQSIDVSDPNQEYSVVISNPYVQTQFITNPIELHGQYAENMGARHDLMTRESEILSALHEQNKKASYEGHHDDAYPASYDI